MPGELRDLGAEVVSVTPLRWVAKASWKIDLSPESDPKPKGKSFASVASEFQLSRDLKITSVSCEKNITYHKDKSRGL